MKHSRKIKFKYFVSILLMILSYLMLFSIFWFKKNFSTTTLDELLFHLGTPLKGGNFSFVKNYLLYLLSHIFYLAIFLGCIGFLKQGFKGRYHFKWTLFEKYDLIFYVNVIFYVSIIIFLFTIYYTSLKLNLFYYVYNKTLCETKIFEKEYVDPKKIKMEFPEEKQNLIYIYLESMESSYQNLNLDGVEQKNLIPNLEKLAKENIHFSNTKKLGGAEAVSGTTWTAAAMTAQTSGSPLKTFYNKDISESLPGVYSLGEVLEKEGYKNYLMIGSDKDFGQRSDYFGQHGNYEIFDLNSARDEGKIPKDYFVFWGYEDLKLFEYAKEKISYLSNQDQPFNFTMLTVDTHFIEGYVDDSCEHLNTNIYANAVMCSDKKVYDFVKWIQNQDFYKNTTIVISGDHLLMGNYLFPVNYDKKRTIYNVFINSKVQPQKTTNRKFTTLDMYPTTLASLGVKIDGERLGLGTNLFSSKKTLAEKMGISKLSIELSKKSNYYNDYLDSLERQE